MTNKFKWEYYLKTAESLLTEVQSSSNNTRKLTAEDKQFEEAKCRCGISRAYYSAFNVAKKYIEKDFSFNDSIFNGSIHKEVIKAYKNSPDKNLKKIGNDLEVLKGHRVRADYYDNFWPKDAIVSGVLTTNFQSDIRLSRNVIKNIEQLSS